MLFDSYLAQRPYPTGTVLVAGAAHAAHEYLTYSHEAMSPTWGDSGDQVAGYFQLGAEKFFAFDNRENQLWDEEFVSAEHCLAWLNPLLDLEADHVRELRPEQLALLDHTQFTVVLAGVPIKAKRVSGPPTPFVATVLASNSQQAIILATQAYHDANSRQPYPPDYVTTCAVFQGYHLPT